MVPKYIVGHSDTQDENVGKTMHKRTEQTNLQIFLAASTSNFV
jgi:hypothetical protein